MYISLFLDRFWFLVNLLHHANDDLCQKCLSAPAHLDDFLVIGLLVTLAIGNALVGYQTEGKCGHFAMAGGDNLFKNKFGKLHTF